MTLVVAAGGKSASKQKRNPGQDTHDKCKLNKSVLITGTQGKEQFTHFASLAINYCHRIFTSLEPGTVIVGGSDANTVA